MSLLTRWWRWVSTGETEPTMEQTNRQAIADLAARMAVAENALRARGWISLAPIQDEETNV